MSERTPALEPFSMARLRGSLYAFGLGKSLAAVIAVIWLLSLVRELNVADYAGYIVLVALLEIVLLISNAGVNALAQRYITEARLPENIARLPTLAWGSLVYRASTLLLVAVILIWAAAPLSAFIGQPHLSAVMLLYALVIVFEGTARYLDLLFEAMLDQGLAQICALFRNGLRLAGLLVLSLVWEPNLGLIDVVRIEAVSAIVGLTLGLCLLAWRLRGLCPAGQWTTGFRGIGLRRMLRFAVPTYAAQAVSQIYGPDAVKLLVSRLFGAFEAAAFGFAHVLSSMIQRYMPASLLIGLIRPMLVSRRSRGASDLALVEACNLVLKVNLACLLAVAALLAAAGNQLTGVASGGKFPHAGPILLALVLLLVLVGLHVVLSALATAIEDPITGLLATLGSVPGIVVGVSLAPSLGPIAMLVGLGLSELLYCCIAVWRLRRGGLRFSLDWAAWMKMGLASTLAAALAIAAVNGHGGSSAWQECALAAGVIALVFPALLWLFQPFAAAERQRLLYLLPARMLARLGIGNSAKTV